MKKPGETINKRTVDYVARLSRLTLNEKENARYREQLSQILNYIDQLKEVDTRDVQPTTHVLSSMKNVFRKDSPRPSLSSEEALSNAPSKKEGHFKVPRIISEK